jgi:predicted nucleic acid-binding protein
VWAAPTPVIAESAWLILERLGTGPHQRFLRLVTSGQLEAIELTDEDWRRCVELTDTYADLRLDLADASLVAVAERLGQTVIATLNYRDFRVVRPKHCEAFELLPEHGT